jgi:steroid delta-isomerase
MPTPAEIRSAVERYVEYMCKSDIDGIMGLYADDARVEDPVGGAQIEGVEAVRTFYAGSAPLLQVELSGPIRVAGGEAAFPMLAELTLGEDKKYIDVIDVMKFDDAGKVVQMLAYWDPADMRAER